MEMFKQGASLTTVFAGQCLRKLGPHTLALCARPGIERMLQRKLGVSCPSVQQSRVFSEKEKDPGLGSVVQFQLPGLHAHCYVLLG